MLSSTQLTKMRSIVLSRRRDFTNMVAREGPITFNVEGGILPRGILLAYVLMYLHHYRPAKDTLAAKDRSLLPCYIAS
ncbi:hypothetical protein THAOC_37841 [Thalassiosira oceanica]|uniref:Uncharacterized protein n=1 Tax=Thalassiosira oceanica TaxID=159749 RepID=K0QYE6_THAOC|nr:hypothetical protein THAOC_37841 [Thalassiosira oceanica]|eukprot:EJK43690.1 hypothetical protein THAOC_37841 [Thalassiosira oceanica]